MIDLNKLKGTPKSVYELDKDLDLFIIKSNNDLSIEQETIDKIRKYSLLDNNVIEIYEFTKVKCVCKFYPNLIPMIIIKENNFYEDEVFLKNSKIYTRFLNDFNKVSHLYNRIVDSYLDFIENTGCYFQDMSGNNILIDPDYNTFRIIDVFSIEKVATNQSIVFSPSAIFMSAKLARGNRVVSCDYGLHSAPADPVLFKYLEGINFKKINDTILSKIKIRSYKKG
tara:strand:- start:66 stop:740 length:675 start_codon:yes stop_codon:yes gene_type:complete